MTTAKMKLIAALQLGPAVLAAVIGYFIVTPRASQWGIAFTIAAVLVALYWLGVLLLNRGSSAAAGATPSRGGGSLPPTSATPAPQSGVQRWSASNVERYILIGLCVGVLVCSATMVVGVIGLARYQGPGALWELLEVATFIGSGAIPLVLLWHPHRGGAMGWIGVWWVCVAYVTLLALNTLRLGLPVEGVTRLALWTAIVVLFTRARRRAVIAIRQEHA